MGLLLQLIAPNIILFIGCLWKYFHRPSLRRETSTFDKADKIFVSESRNELIEYLKWHILLLSEHIFRRFHRESNRVESYVSTTEEPVDLPGSLNRNQWQILSPQVKKNLTDGNADITIRGNRLREIIL